MGPGGVGERHVDVEGPTDSERRFNEALAFLSLSTEKRRHTGARRLPSDAIIQQRGKTTGSKNTHWSATRAHFTFLRID